MKGAVRGVQFERGAGWKGAGWKGAEGHSLEGRSLEGCSAIWVQCSLGGFSLGEVQFGGAQFVRSVVWEECSMEGAVWKPQFGTSSLERATCS